MNEKSTKRYRWLRLQRDFFNQKCMKKLRRIAGGEIFTIIYLKLQLLSITTGGVLSYDGVDETFADELALVIDESADNIQVALNFMRKNGLIRQLGANEFLLPEAATNIGSEGESAERMRRMRSRASQCDVAVTPLLHGGDVDNNRTDNTRIDNNKIAIPMALHNMGITESVAQQLVEQYGPERVAANVAYAETKKNLQDVAAFTVQAIKKNYAASVAAVREKRANPHCTICHGTGRVVAVVGCEWEKKQEMETVCDCVR